MRLRFFLAVLLACAAATATSQELRRSGFIGVQVGPDKDGVAVLALIDGGSAKDAGLAAGDLITAIDGRGVSGVADFVARVSRLRAGDRVVVDVRRQGSMKAIEVPVKPRPQESSPDASTRYGSVEVDGHRRRTIVTVPRGEGRHPAILFLTGIGCFSQESLGLQSLDSQLLYALTRDGFVTMRVEKSGAGDSEGPPCTSREADLQAEIRGYAAGLRALREYPYVDADNVFLLGLSIGGVEAPVVAQQSAVRGIVVVNTVARPLLEYLMHIRRHQGTLRHAPYDELDERLRLNERCNHALLVEKKSADAIVRDQPSCKELVEYPAPDTFMQQWADITPAREWKRIAASVLIVDGGFDFVAGTSEAPMLRDMIESFHPGKATLERIATMDHYLRHVESMKDALASTPASPGRLEPELLDRIRGWLRHMVRVGR